MIATFCMIASIYLSAISGITQFTTNECAKQIQIAGEKIEAEKRKEAYLKEQIELAVNEALDKLEEDFNGYTYISSRRKKVVHTAQSLEGKVCYEWGVKSEKAGWNDKWNTRKNDEGQLYGLDCSGFVGWAFLTAVGKDVGYSTEAFSKAKTISYEDLRPGDIGLIFEGGSNEERTNHVGIYVGKDQDGNDLWCHCDSGANTVITNNTTCFKVYKRMLNN